MKFIAVGDNCIDNYITLNKMFPGGNAVNFAVFIRRLGFQSSYFGFIGNDNAGCIILSALEQNKVDYSHLKRVRGKTAVTYIKLVGHQRFFVNYDQGVNGSFSLTEEDISYILSHDYLHTVAWGNMDKYLKILSNKIVISYDFSDEYTCEKLLKVAPLIDYAFLSYVKDDEIIRKLLKSLVSQGILCAVATMGENGSLAYDGIKFYKEGILDVEVVDTLGAGDAFISAFMAGVAKKLSIEDCLKKGKEFAADVISRFGAL